MEAYRSGVGGDGGDDEEEDKGDDHLQEEGVHGGNERHGGPTGEEGVVDAFEGEGGAHGGGHLRDDVSRHVRPGEVVEDGEGDGDGGVEVGPGDVARGQDDDHDGQARAESVSEESFDAAVLLVDDGSRRGPEDENERPQKLRSELLGDGNVGNPEVDEVALGIIRRADGQTTAARHRVTLVGPGLHPGLQRQVRRGRRRGAVDRVNGLLLSGICGLSHVPFSGFIGGDAASKVLLGFIGGLRFY